MSDFCYAAPDRDRILRQSELMDRMIVAVGADQGAARLADDRGEWFAARTRCIECPSVEACVSWLGRHDGARAEPEFCPNLAVFQGCGGDDGT